MASLGVALQTLMASPRMASQREDDLSSLLPALSQMIWASSAQMRPASPVVSQMPRHQWPVHPEDWQSPMAPFGGGPQMSRSLPQSRPLFFDRPTFDDFSNKTSFGQPMTGIRYRPSTSNRPVAMGLLPQNIRFSMNDTSSESTDSSESDYSVTVHHSHGGNHHHDPVSCFGHNSHAMGMCNAMASPGVSMRTPVPFHTRSVSTTREPLSKLPVVTTTPVTVASPLTTPVTEPKTPKTKAEAEAKSESDTQSQPRPQPSSSASSEPQSSKSSESDTSVVDQFPGAADLSEAFQSLVSGTITQDQIKSAVSALGEISESDVAAARSMFGGFWSGSGSK